MHHEFGSLPRESNEVRADVAFVDRSAEREALRGLLARAADGYSGALVLRGEVGVGKTALLNETVAAAAAAGMQTIRLTGVEPETHLSYAGLHWFLLPFADHLERLPAPQRDALRSTFGLVAGPPADRFLVALAVLTLLAEAASAAPLVCVVDDVQWLDPESAVVLGFVARRLYAERVVLLFAVREPAGELPALAGLPELAIAGLDEGAALELLASLAPGPLSPAVGARIVAETGGNPLALVEVARELSPGQLAGVELLPEPLPVGGSLEEAFGRRVSRLPAEARLLLAVAAAEPAASQALVWRAAGQLGIDPDAAASADLGGLAAIGSQVEFRHPLIRSVVYHTMPLRQRRLIHRALAAAGDGSEPDRVAWHLGMAAAGPDEAVAARLEQAAGRARDRGGYAATVMFLSRAAELSADAGLRAGRLLAAAEAALIAGQPVRAGLLLEAATPKLGDPLARAQARRLHGTIRCALGQAGEASSILLAAAQALAPYDPRGARETLLEAVEAALFAGWSASQAVMPEVAAAARAMPGVPESEASAADLLLDGFVARAAAGYPAAVPLFRRAIAMFAFRRAQPGGGPARIRARRHCRSGAVGRPGPAHAGQPLDPARPRPWGADRASGSAQLRRVRRDNSGPVRRRRGMHRRAIGDHNGNREPGHPRDGRSRGAASARLARSRDRRAPDRVCHRPRGDERRARLTEHLGPAWPGRARARPGQLPGGAPVCARRFLRRSPVHRHARAARPGRGRRALRRDRDSRGRARAARRAGGRGRHPAGARAARPVPGAARRRRRRRAAVSSRPSGT